MAVLPLEPTDEEKNIYQKVRWYFSCQDIECRLKQLDIDINSMTQQDFDCIVDSYRDAVYYDWSEVADECIRYRLEEA